MPYIELQKIHQSEPVNGYKVRFVHSDHMTLAFWEVSALAELPEHAHPHEQVSVVTRGKFELTIDGKKQILQPGMVAVIPSNAKHAGKAITECEIIDTFYPVREDYK